MTRQNETGGSGGSAEHDLIARYFRPLAASLPGTFKLLDDAASLEIGAGQDLVVTSDALVAGVHFFPDDAAADVGFKALAVNVSDLAAKGALPLAYSLSLVLERGPDENWLSGFASGLAEAQAEFGIAMSGGDTVSSKNGPLMISITAFGTIEAGRMIKRSTACDGDALYVTGTIGDAALGLQLRLPGSGAGEWTLAAGEKDVLLERYLRPRPRHALRSALLQHAHAAMDISDGLAIDASRLCRSSCVEGTIEAAKVPLSAAAVAVIAQDAGMLETAMTGGDDYEILAAIPPDAADAFERGASAANIRATRIGTLRKGTGDLSIIGPDGGKVNYKSLGYDHLNG